MNTAADVVAAARGEIGTTEDPAGSNCNPYAPEAHLTNCTFWCAAGTSAMLIREQVTVPPGVLTLSTRANLAAWKKAGRFIQPADIIAGDIPFFHISGRNGADHSIPDHTGIATGPPKNGRLPTVEFNTSSDDAGSQDNGGGVYPKNRPLSVVIGAGRPDYNNGGFMPGLSDQEQRDLFNNARDASIRSLELKSAVAELEQKVDALGHGSTGALSDADVARIATAVLDEQHKRDAS